MFNPSIFEMAADGGSLRTIAKTLNQDSVPSPRPRSGKQYATWCPTAIREMLRRDLYAGRIVWNRSRFVKQPGTNKRLRRERPQSEWLITEKPELRIIDEGLWDRVQARLIYVAETYGYANHPGFLHRASTSPHLLTGFLKCGECGANLVVVSGRGNAGHHHYGCPQNFYRGVCRNNVKQRVDVIEDRLFSELQEAVLKPEIVDSALQEFERDLTAAMYDMNGRIGQMRHRAAEIESELANLISTAARCGHSPAIIEAINGREQELKAITRQLLSTEPNSVSAEIARIRQFVTERVRGLRNLFNIDVQKAKRELAKHVAEIRMMPQAAEKRRGYVAEGQWNLLGGYGDGGNQREMSVGLVAGDCNVPNGPCIRFKVRIENASRHGD